MISLRCAHRVKGSKYSNVLMSYFHRCWVSALGVLLMPKTQGWDKGLLEKPWLAFCSCLKGKAFRT